MMKENLIKYHDANRYKAIFNSEGLRGKLEHIGRVKETAKAIAQVQHAPVDMELLEALAEHHDDGRVKQYELLGKFWDTEVSHNILGADRLEKFIVANDLVIDKEIELLRNVMLYHGRQHLMYKPTVEEMVYIGLITAADDFENATSCISYLVKEVETDAKGYVVAEPDSDQMKISSDFVWECYTQGEKFDKMKVCKTYADYILFAGTLATSCIKKYGEIAKTAMMQSGYGYESVLEGFKDVFDKTLEPLLARKAYAVLEETVRM